MKTSSRLLVEAVCKRLTGKFGFLSLPVLFMSSCTHPSAGSERIILERRPKSSESFDGVWRKFQKAARSKDVAGMSELIRLPLPYPFYGLEAYPVVKDTQGVGNHFDELFPEEAMTALMTTPSGKVKVENESGKTSWHFSYIQDEEVSEQEWAISYTFEKLPDGSVKLTKVDRAG